jgi:hypothetical protein
MFGRRFVELVESDFRDAQIAADLSSEEFVDFAMPWNG